MVASARDLAALIKLSHTLFALPFAVLSLLVATGGRPAPILLLQVVGAVVAARTAAMAYNRFADRAIDAGNPRTANREIPRGAVSPAAAMLLVVVAAGAFVAICWSIGDWCAAGSAPVLLWLLAYSHSKRWTRWCHLWLGVALGLAPLAAWVAAGDAAGAVDVAGLGVPLLLSLAVTSWVAGFDVLYACQDEEFDKDRGLRSIPATLGRGRSLWLARGLHVLAVVLFFGFGFAAGLSLFYALGVVAAAALLWWQHRALQPDHLGRLGPGLFTANGILSVVMLAAGALDIYAG